MGERERERSWAAGFHFFDYPKISLNRGGCSFFLGKFSLPRSHYSLEQLPKTASPYGLRALCRIRNAPKFQRGSLRDRRQPRTT